MKEQIKDIIGMSIFGIGIIGFLIVIYFFGIAGIFEILGVHYQSLWSLTMFVISVFLLGLPVDLIVGAIAKLSVVKIQDKLTAFVIEFLFAFATNWFVIFTVDRFMSSITLSLGAILIVSLLLSFFELVFSGENK